MKRSLFIFGMLLAGTTIFSSCTKDLKDDVKDLQGKVTEIEGLIGSNEPIIATTTFKDDNDANRTVTDTYKFKSSGYQTQYLIKNDDGTYDIYIERFSDVGWNEGAWVEFTYNPTTKAITEKRGGHYWDDADDYYDRARYDESYYNNGLTLNITVEKLDVNTGEIVMKFNAAGTADYTSGVSYSWVPNQGKPVSTSFAFTGKLQVFDRD